MIGRKFAAHTPTADIVAGLCDLGDVLYPVARKAEIPAPVPLNIASEGAEGLAGVLFGDGTRHGRGFAQLCGWHAWHARDSRGQNIVGFPDWVLVRECVLFVELKRQRDELAPQQVDAAARLIAAGANYYLVRPSDFVEFCAVLVHGPK
jgi:hypothetical protein